MEIEYFIPPGDEHWPVHHSKWVDTCWRWLVDIGVREDLLQKTEHEQNNLAHYARACTDITFRFPFGQQELMGIAARGNFDLRQHGQHSGKSLDYLDPSTNERYVPHVIEPSMGVERLFLAVLASAYREEIVDGEKRVVLGFTNDMAPVKASILPLLSNKPELAAKAKNIYHSLQRRYNVEYDTSGAIGRRYRRADEAGTPFCITVDFETLSADTVTVRKRDTMEQLRIPTQDLLAFLSKEIDGL